MKRDLGVLRLGVDHSSAEKWHYFNGAIEAATRLGFDVRLRVVRDPSRTDVHAPLDVYAEAETPTTQMEQEISGRAAARGLAP